MSRTLVILALCIALTRCVINTGPKLEDFEFTALELGQTIEESVDARAFAAEIVFVGQFRTRHTCFELRPEVERKAGSMTLRIDAQPRNVTCLGVTGAYRYNGVIRRAEPGRYDFHVVHVVPGQPDRTHTFDLLVR